MALIKGKVAGKAVDLYEFPEVPDIIPRDRWDRPLIVPLDGGAPIAYTRASTLGKAIEDTYHLNKWLQRSVAFGLSRRPDLVALVAAVATNEGDDRGRLDELCEKAHEAAKGDAGANVGTALHKLSERRDAGENLSYLREDLLVALDSYAEHMGLFKILASETFVVCDPLLTAGSFDRVVMLLVDLEFHHKVLGRVVIPAGTVLVLDLKTGKLESAKYWGPTYGVQQTVYACGQPYRPDEGRMDWEEILGQGVAPSTRWALILHVPSDSPKDAGLVVVDLEIGAVLAELCVEVRQGRRTKGLMSEAYPVTVAPLAIESVEVVDAELVPMAELADQDQARDQLLCSVKAARAEIDLNDLWRGYQHIWTDEHTAAAKERLAELAAGQPEKIEVPESAIAALREPNPAGAKLKLITQLRQATDDASLTALWEAHAEVWDDDCTRMAKARARELSAT